jgi:hypothetical protein
MGLARAAAASASVVIVLFHVNVILIIDGDRDGRSSRISASLRVSAISGSSRLPLLEALDAVNVRRRCLGLASLCDGRLSPGFGPWSAPTAGADPNHFKAAFQQLF